MTTSIIPNALRKLFSAGIALLLITSCSGGTSELPNASSVSAQEAGTNNPINDSSYIIAPGRNELLKINALTGASTVLIEFDLAYEFLGPVDVVDNTIIVSVDDNTLSGVDVNTGEFL